MAGFTDLLMSTFRCSNSRYQLLGLRLMLFWCLSGLTLYGQENIAETDSLKQVLTKQLPDTTIVQTLNKLGEIYIPQNLDSASYYGHKALEAAQKRGYHEGEFESIRILSTITANKESKPAALKMLYEALRITQKANNEQLEQEIWGLIASHYRAEKIYDSSIFSQKKQYDLALSRQETPENRVKIATNLIFAYLTNTEFDNAIEVINSTKDILAKEEVSPKTVSSFYRIIRDYHYLNKQYPLAREFADKALLESIKAQDKKGEIDSYLYLGELHRLSNNNEQAIDNLTTALELSDRYKIDESVLRISQRLSYIYRDEKLYDEAIKHTNVVLSIAQENNDSVRLITSNYILGEIYLLSGNEEKGKATMLKSKAIFEKGKNTIRFHKYRRRDIYRGLSRIDSILGDFKGSLAYYKIYAELESEIEDIKVKERVEELEVQYKTKEKSKEIELLNAKNDAQQVASGQQKRIIWLISSIGFLLLLLSLILYNRFRIKKRSMAVIQQKIEENEQLVQEVHHRVKNNLQIMLSLLQTQSNLIDDDKAKLMIKESSNRIKSMALIHENLYHSGDMVMVKADNYFKDLTTNVIHSFNRNDQDIHIDMDIINEEISMTLAVPIGLILNELITNSFKYAFVGRTKGKLIINFRKVQNGEYYNLQVVDDGKGLPVDLNIHDSSSFGLRLVSGLAEQLNGHVNINHQEGTEFDIYIKDEKIV